MTNSMWLRKLKIFWNLNNEHQVKLTNVLNFKQWTYLNYFRWILWMIPSVILGIIASILCYFYLPQLKLISYLIWLLFVAIGVVFTIVGLNGRGFYKYLILKHNDRYPKIIESGSAFFLQDVRWPWKAETDWYNSAILRYYHLPEADWIIASRKVKVDDKVKKAYFNELHHIFTYDDKDSIYDKPTIIGLFEVLKRLSSINEIISALMSFSDCKLQVSKKEFISLVNELIDKNQKTHPLVEHQHLPKMPNALNCTPSGGGKTTAVVYPQIIANATAKVQGSMFITDPKGEILNNTGNWLKVMGYDVYSFNLKDLHKSEGWNPLSDVYEDVLIRGYLTQLLASYQKHNLDEYEQFSIVYNKDINIQDVLDVPNMITKIETDEEYRKDMLRIFLEFDKQLYPISKCSIHTEELYVNCVCLKNADIYVDYGNVIYAGVENILQLYRVILPTLISTKVNQIINALMNPDKQQVGGDNAFWDENAKNLFQSAIWVMLEKKELNVFDKTITQDNLNLYSLYRFTIDRNTFNPNTFGLDYRTGEGMSSSLKEGWLSKLGDSEKDQYLKLYQTTRNSYTIGGKVIALPDKTRTIVEGVVAQHLVSILNEGAKYATSFAELDFNKIVKSKKPFAIYMAIDLQDTTYHKLGVLFISMLYQKLIWWAEQQKDLKLPRPFMFVLDEVGNLPAIPNLGKILSLSRSYRVMMLLIIQSIKQLEKYYKEDVDTILENCKYKIIRGADDFNTAKRWSDTIGNTTIKKQSENFHKQRALITPDEILDLDFAQRHQCLYFTTVFDPDSKAAYTDTKTKKPKWMEVSQQAGNYKFIQRQDPWYVTYNTKLFNQLGAIPVGVKTYLESERVINYDALNLDQLPVFNSNTKEHVFDAEETESHLNDILNDLNIFNKSQFNYEMDDKNEDFTDDFDDLDNVDTLDSAAKVSLIMENNDIIANDEYKDLSNIDKQKYQTMTFNEFAKHFKESDEDDLASNIVITDRNNDELIADFIKLLDDEYEFIAEIDLNTLLDKFADNINLKRFSLLLHSLINVNNIFINEKDYIGTNQENNVKYINQITNKIIIFLLYGKNNFTETNVFDKSFNKYFSTLPELRDKFVGDNYYIVDMLNQVKDYLKTSEGETFRKQFIIDHINKYDQEEQSYEEYWKQHWKEGTKYFDSDWVKYIYNIVYKK